MSYTKSIFGKLKKNHVVFCEDNILKLEFLDSGISIVAIVLGLSEETALILTHQINEEESTSIGIVREIMFDINIAVDDPFDTNIAVDDPRKQLTKMKDCNYLMGSTIDDQDIILSHLKEADFDLLHKSMLKYIDHYDYLECYLIADEATIQVDDFWARAKDFFRKYPDAIVYDYIHTPRYWNYY
uniref:DUF4303 domain-containing protein n=1 Tax=Rhabditophanes sp. KR3021 TaxID=114890 RepID=A0AC35U9R8_9BILA